MLGRNAIGGSITTIERLRLSCQIVSGRWSHFSWPSSAAATPVFFERRCMKFTFRGFSGGMPHSLLMCSEPEEHCSRFWFISSSRQVGNHPWKRASRNKASLRKIRLFILTQAALYLTALRGHASEACICYERVESLCNSLNRPRLLYVALQGQWRYSYAKNKPSAALQIAERIHSMAQEQNDPTLMIGAYNLLAGTLHYLGDMGTAHQYVMRGVQIWRSGSVQSHAVQENSNRAPSSVLAWRRYASGILERSPLAKR